MPDHLRVNQDRGIIEINSTGLVTKEDIAGSFQRARELLQAQGLNKLLVDTRQQVAMPNTSDIFDLFSNFPFEFRVALLVSDSQATGDAIAFVETVAVNRGMEMKIFKDHKKALIWLNKGGV